MGDIKSTIEKGGGPGKHENSKGDFDAGLLDTDKSSVGKGVKGEFDSGFLQGLLAAKAYYDKGSNSKKNGAAGNFGNKGGGFKNGNDKGSMKKGNNKGWFK